MQIGRFYRKILFVTSASVFRRSNSRMTNAGMPMAPVCAGWVVTAMFWAAK
jgi:hypothetical protein